MTELVLLSNKFFFPFLRLIFFLLTILVRKTIYILRSYIYPFLLGFICLRRRGIFASLTKPAMAGYWFTWQISLGEGTAVPSHHPLLSRESSTLWCQTKKALGDPFVISWIRSLGQRPTILYVPQSTLQNFVIFQVWTRATDSKEKNPYKPMVFGKKITALPWGFYFSFKICWRIYFYMFSFEA